MEEAERVIAEENAPERRLSQIDVLRASGEISDEEAAAMERDVIESMLSEEL